MNGSSYTKGHLKKKTIITMKIEFPLTQSAMDMFHAIFLIRIPLDMHAHTQKTAGGPCTFSIYMMAMKYISLTVTSLFC